MTSTRTSRVSNLAFCAFAFALFSTHAIAAEFPQRTVKIVVPFPPGSVADGVPRILAARLQSRWGQPVVVENVPGAAGTTGSAGVARASPDGYTLLATPAGPLVINRFVQNAFPFDPLQLTPIAITVTLPTVLVVKTTLPVATVSEFVAYAKTRAGALNYASPGLGSTQHLSAVMFQNMAGVELVHVPYKGTAPALNDMIGGHVDLMFDNLGSTLSLHREGKIKILAVGTAKRMPSLPEMPTISETGVAGYESGSWIAFVGPPHMPVEIAGRISTALAEIVRTPEITAQFSQMGLEIIGSTMGGAGDRIAADSRKWEAVVKTANIAKN